MILGLTTPTSGTVQAFGSAPRQAIAASKIGAVLQTGGLLGNLTVWETVAMIATTFPNPQLPETVLRRTNSATSPGGAWLNAPVASSSGSASP